MLQEFGVPSVEGLLYCSSLSMLPFWLSTTKTSVLLDYSPLSQRASHRYPSLYLTAELIAMAEMADLASALNKMEVSKKSEEASPPAASDKPMEGGSPSPPSDKPAEEASTPAASKPAEEASAPAASDKPMEEASPPASSDKQEGDKSPPHREEVTRKLGGSKEEDPSPPESKQPKDSVDDDLLEFTSATKGEASSSAWELVPEQKIARKKGVKSDSEIDSMLKKVIKEAEQPEKAQVTSKDVTASSGASSTSAKDAVASIPEDPAAEAAEEEGSKAEALAAEKPVTSGWEADFSLEDAPTPPSKDVLIASMGRKNLMVAGAWSHPRG